MKKLLPVVFLLIILFFNQSGAQVGLGIFGLPPGDAKEYTKPMATYLGTYFNSGGYYSADLPKLFQFKFSIIGMYSVIPEGQKTFTPNPGLAGYENLSETATFVGGKGGVYLGPQGFLVYPGGFNVSNIPSGIYQIAGSFYGTELLLRFFPDTKFSDVKSGLWGVGLKHTISQWIPAAPVDIALQVLFNNFDLEYDGDSPETDYVKLDSKNFAVNVHASKTFNNMFIVYGGLQYESSSLDLEYVFSDPNDLYPQIKDTRQSTSIDGDNVFRVTAGGAIKLAVVVFNLDFNITSMFTISGGVSLQL